MRYLGIDYGSAKTGLALSDEAGTMGFPRAVVPTTELRGALTKLFEDERIDAVVIGDSRTLAGVENPIAQEARVFGAWVEKEFSVPLHWESEVFTSAEARRTPAPEEKSRKPKSHAPVDASAAALILTNYLSRNHG